MNLIHFRCSSPVTGVSRGGPSISPSPYPCPPPAFAAIAQVTAASYCSLLTQSVPNNSSQIPLETGLTDPTELAKRLESPPLQTSLSEH